MIKLLIGGSPCTHWSIAQSKNRETEAEGIGWELFKNYLSAKEKFQPDFFLYENNKSAAQAIKSQISTELGAPLQYINSALVSAQNRQRFYAHNFGDVPQPEDRGIMLRDILESGEVWREKSYCIDANYYKGGNLTSFEKQSGKRLMVAEEVKPPIVKMLSEREVDYMFRKGGRTEYGYIQNAELEKAKCITANISKGVPYNVMFERSDGKLQPIYEVREGQITIKEKQYPIRLPDGYYIIRKLTITEACRLQTLPDDYCRAVSATQAYKGIGNGWTAEVIIHLLSHGLAGIPKDEEIVVVSMYDGIGTGRCCLDKLGFTNVKYYAYEIDKYAMQIAQSNYPDIIQCGDAFAVREDGWAFLN